jgi:glycosyltransferase involved in cell wall biosynthesis
MSASQNDKAVCTPCVAVVTPHKAVYFKPLYESFAGAQPSPWRTVIVWPEGHDSEHPQELITPVADNLEIRLVESRKVVESQRRQHAANWMERRRFFPSLDLWRTLSEIAPRMVMIQEYSPFSLAGLLYAKFHRIPVVTFTEVGRRNLTIFSLRVRLWHGFWSRWVNGIVAACPTAHDPASGRFLPSLAAYHAVDSRLYAPVESKPAGGAITFVYVGQLIRRKGLDLWIKAARALKAETKTEFRLRLIGGGDEAWVRGLVAEAGLEDGVEWCGFLSGEALREAMRSGDVFVLPSREDTYAVVTHEAACLGLPLLISKHAGSAEALVREGVNGFIINPEDTEGFKDAMCSMLDGVLRKKMGEAARAVGEEMSAHNRGAALWRWMSSQFHLQDTRVASALSETKPLTATS